MWCLDEDRFPLGDLNFETILCGQTEGAFLLPQAEDSFCLWDETQEHCCVDHSDWNPSAGHNPVRTVKFSKQSVILNDYEKAYERKAALMERLKKRAVRFEDVRDLYEERARQVFHTDILYEMHFGADIYEEKPKYYRCRGRVNDDAPPPSENVSIAMFHLLKKPQTLFELRFQLYSQGHRKYNPEYLLILEKALAVVGVHPMERKVQMAGGGTANAKLLEVWKKVQNFREEEFEQYLKKREKPTVTQQDHKRIIRHLFRLKGNGDLEKLYALKASLSLPVNEDPFGVRGVASFKSKRRAPLLRALMENKNKTISIDTLCTMAQVSNTSRKDSSPRHTLLKLALEGFPIIYDRGLNSFTFLDGQVPVVKPPERTNVITMVYDFVKKYGSDFAQYEMAYYAYRGGYWTGGALHVGRENFEKEVNFYKEFLAIKGLIQLVDCKSERRIAVDRMKSLFALVPKEGEEEDFAFYQKTLPDIVQDDFYRVVAMKSLEERVEYHDLLHHTQLSFTQLSNEEKIQRELCHHPLKAKSLLLAFQICFWKKPEDMWNTVKKLTLRKEGGRAVYDPKTTLFFWDSEGAHVAIDAEKYVAEIFLLKRKYVDLTDYEFEYMLAQRGAEDVNIREIKKVLRGLELLGLCDAQKEDYGLERKKLRTLLKSGEVSDEQGCATKCQEGEIAQEVYSWLRSGAMEHLWRAYLQVKDSKIQQEAEGDDEGQAPSCKRRKLEESWMCAEEIIARDIPELKAFLFSKGF